MKSYINGLTGFVVCAAICAGLFSACKDIPTSDKLEKATDYNGKIVINEVMAQNYTGLLDKHGELSDWIEIKNISSGSIDLTGYSLRLDEIKEVKDTADAKNDSTKVENDSAKVKKNKSGKKDSDKDKKEKEKEWKFPEMKLDAGETVLIYATGKKASKENQTDELEASFKLSAKKTHLMLLNGNKIQSEVSYRKLNADQVLRRLEDGTYEKSYQPTPGFDNDKDGFEAYNTLIDKQRKSPLLIWEVMSRESKTDLNWVEVRNLADTAISLNGYCLTNNPKEMDKWHFPAVTVQPGECFVVPTKGKMKGDQNRLNANFKLKGDESVLLTKNGKFVDGVCAKPTSPGTSIGRAANHAGFYFFASPSKGVVAAGEPCRYIADKPVFVTKPGIYPKAKRLSVIINANGAKVHYTIDGSEPNASSPLWKDSLVITKSTVIRCFAEGSANTLRSRVNTGTFFVHEKHTIAMMNISVAESDLYDYNTGIYATGPGGGGPFPHTGANYWKDWEKSANIEFYDGKNSFSIPCGLKIFGGFSRAENKKSFSIKFRPSYGSDDLCFDLYKQGKATDVKRFILRSGSQDYSRVMIRDEYFTSLMHKTNPDLIVQAYRPVALYVNAKYFGLYYIREKFDEDFVAEHLNVSSDSISVIFSKYLEKGSRVTYDQVLNYVKSHTMKTKADFDYAASLIDFTSLIDQKLGEIYSGNTDVGNVRIVRSTDPKGDRKWHWVFYDLDATWVGAPNAASHLSTSSGVAVHNVLIANLLKSPDFRKLFLERLSLHMHKTFTPKNATAVFDNLINTIKPEMPLNCQRWPELTYEKWLKNAADFRAKFADRDKLMLDNIRQTISITPQENKQYFGDLGF